MRGIRGLAVAVSVLLATAAFVIGGLVMRPRQATTAVPDLPTHLEVPISIPPTLWGGRKIVLNVRSPDGASQVKTTLWGDPFVAAALSRDGRTIAYVGTEPAPAGPSPRAGIWVRPLGSSGARYLHGTEDAARLSFSPDGSQLAFVWWDRGSRGTEVRRVPVDGGPVVTVLEDPTGLRYSRYSSPQWLSDSELLVVSSSPVAVHRVSVESAETTLVAAIESDGHTDWHGAYHPVPVAGRRAVLVTRAQITDHGLRKSLVMVDLDSGATTTVLPDAEYGLVAPGGRLVFVRRSKLCVAPFDPDTMLVSGPETVMATGLAKGTIACSDDGTLIFAHDTTDPMARPVMVIDGEGNRAPLLDLTGPFAGQVRVSPDGRQIAVDVIKAPDQTEAHVIDLARQRLLPDGHVDLAVASPDLQSTPELLFTGDGGGGTFFNAEFTPDGSSAIGDYQPAGRREGGLYALDLRRPGEPAPIVLTSGLTKPAISPDGRWLAHGLLADGRYRVVVRAVDPERSGSSSVIWSSGATATDPFWSTDGSELYFIDHISGNIMGAAFGSDPESRVHAPKTIVTGKMMGRLRGGDGRLRGVDVLPDGRFVYIGQPVQQVPSRLQVVLNSFGTTSPDTSGD
jgi:Tol biopolymer transport system component